MKNGNFKKLTRDEMKTIAAGRFSYCPTSCNPDRTCTSSLCACVSTGYSGNTPTYGCTGNIGQQ